MKKYTYKCSNCFKKFTSKSKEFQDLCSEGCIHEYEQFVIKTKSNDQTT